MGCNKNGVFFSAANCKKDTIFGAARKTLGPSHFVTVLGTFGSKVGYSENSNFSKLGSLKLVFLEFFSPKKESVDMVFNRYSNNYVSIPEEINSFISWVC